MTVLFVNACLRGDESRTLTLCREYLEGIEDVKEVNLSELRLKPYYGDSAAYRAQLEAKGLFDDPMFDIGKDFAEADEIVIGAPYWDLSFPAALKIYIEHAAVMGMTFHYTALRGAVPRQAPHLHHHGRRPGERHELRLRVPLRHRRHVRHSRDAFRLR